MMHQQRTLDSPTSRQDRPPKDSGIFSPEIEAVRAGVRAGDAALAGFYASGVLLLFSKHMHLELSAQRLDALRTYAELRRALLPSGHDIPATSLVAAGYTIAEIAQFNAAIAAIPSKLDRLCGGRPHSP